MLSFRRFFKLFRVIISSLTGALKIKNNHQHSDHCVIHLRLKVRTRTPHDAKVINPGYLNMCDQFIWGRQRSPNQLPAALQQFNIPVLGRADGPSRAIFSQFLANAHVRKIRQNHTLQPICTVA